MRELTDGGMGSLAIAPFANRRFGGVAAQYVDSDRMSVSAQINLNQRNAPLDIDVWEIDFSPTLQWPGPKQIYAGPP